MKTAEDLDPAETSPLLAPHALKAELPLTAPAAENVARTRRKIRDLLHGHDRRRLLVVVGPCSIHDPEAALDYAARLVPVARATSEELLIVMRTYVEKPRTTIGWKGIVNDPRLDGSCDVGAGLALARRLLLDINHLGLACATELLDPLVPRYLADLVSWAAIGARTCESQPHREMASGLPMPVGFKNATDGSLERARNAMIAAGRPHRFVGIGPDGTTAIVRTGGNPDRHIVLRGGESGPNYGAQHVARAAALVAGEGIARPVLVDCSHDNSGGDHTRQGEICRAVLSHVCAGREAILGVMLESYLLAGRQRWTPGEKPRRGVSITDACIGWEETEALLFELADGLRPRRPSSRPVSGPGAPRVERSGGDLFA